MKYEPIFQFLRIMIRVYIHESAKMDVKISYVLNRKTILKPFPVPDEVDQFQYRFIENEL